MLKIIDGKRYNTNTAEKLASYDNGLGCSDFNSYEEALYKTKKGAYFLAGEGGPMTKYARSISMNERTGSRDIIPLSKEEALQWCEDTGNEDAAEEYFSNLLEDA